MALFLYGPSGCGKTYASMAIAGELNASLCDLSLTGLKGKYIGETEVNIHRFFNKVEAIERIVVCIDEAEIDFNYRRTDGFRFLILDKLKEFMKPTNKLRVVLAISRSPWVVDDRYLRADMFSDKMYLGLPNHLVRKRIIENSVHGLPVDENATFYTFADKTVGYSGADVRMLCEKAKQSACQRQIASNKDEFITEQDFYDALEMIRPTVNKETIRKFEDWGNR